MVHSRPISASLCRTTRPVRDLEPRLIQCAADVTRLPSLASSRLARIGLRLSDWFERWFPDAFALALAAVAIVFVATLFVGSTPAQTAQWFGAGFWDLVTFTMQMTHDHRDRLRRGDGAAGLRGDPADGRAAEDRPEAPPHSSALFSMLSSLLSWSFSLIFSALLAREVAHRVRGADYRAVGAAAYLGVGSVWALGLSSSAALIMAAPASLPRRPSSESAA